MWSVQMKRVALFGLVLVVSSRSAFGADPGPTVRPITEADTVLAVIWHDYSLAAASPSYAIISAIWPDGYVVWSGDRRRGGAPYYSGLVDPKKVAAVTAGFERDELFSIGSVNAPRLSIDTQFIELLVKAGKHKLSMRSSHELEGRNRPDDLRKESAEHLFYRLVWSETRASLAELIPNSGKVSTGKPVMKAGVLKWHDGPAEPSKK
jgi:hypothetical protein